MDTNILSPEIIFDILINLSYKELQPVCSTNTQYSQICNSPYFWRQKLLHDFGIQYDPNNYNNLDEYDFYRYILSQTDTFPGCEKYTDINTCLVRAIDMNNLPLITYFLDNGADLSKALKSAVEASNINLVNIFVDKGADPKSILIKYLDNKKSLSKADPDIFTDQYFNQVTYLKQPIVFPQSMLDWLIKNLDVGLYPYNILVYRGNLYMAPQYTEYRGYGKGIEAPMYVDLENIQTYDGIIKVPIITRQKYGNQRGVSYITWD